MKLLDLNDRVFTWRNEFQGGKTVRIEEYIQFEQFLTDKTMRNVAEVYDWVVRLSKYYCVTDRVMDLAEKEMMPAIRPEMVQAAKKVFKQYREINRQKRGY